MPLKDVSHQIIDIKEDGNTIKVTAVVLDTPAGRSLEAAIKEGIPMIAARRGTGIINHGIVSDFVLESIDFIREQKDPE